MSIALCTAAGSAVNIWLAHYCLLNHSPPFPTWPHLSAQQYWDRYVDQSDGYGPANFDHISAAIGCDFFIIDASPPDLGNGAPPRMMITRAGFPFRCVEGMHSWGGVSPSHNWAIPIDPQPRNVAWVSVLPYRPHVFGLIMNTAVFGCIVWIAMFGPFALYRSIQHRQRRRMRCCHQCGYDLQGNLAGGCP